MSLGTEWVIDASGCNAETLADIEQLKLVFDHVIHDLEFHVVGDISWHQFPAPRRCHRTRASLRIAPHLSIPTPSLALPHLIFITAVIEPRGRGKECCENCSGQLK